jgi:Skp family chaperone for outer membrane proteins
MYAGLMRRPLAALVPVLSGVIARAAARDGYDLVLDTGAASYTIASLDVTDRMIKAYDDGA